MTRAPFALLCGSVLSLLVACQAPPAPGTEATLPAQGGGGGLGGDPGPQPVAPAPVMAPPAQPRTHHLAEIAQELGSMSEVDYDAIQEKWLDTAYPACNFFVTTALCQDGQCGRGVPDVLAENYGTYLLGLGWQQITLTDLVTYLQTGADFDAILQRDGVGGGPGHVSIPIGIASDGDVIVAEGELGTITHEILDVTDSYLETYEGGMNVYVSNVP